MIRTIVITRSSCARALAAACAIFYIDYAVGQEKLGSAAHVPYRQVFYQPEEWYASDEATRIADNVLLFQHDNGGWPKNTEMARRLTAGEKDRIRATRHTFPTTIDNGATYREIRFLARVGQVAGHDRYMSACRRGIEFLLNAQYDNGGWPQFYPTRPGYSQYITLNDGAMIGVMRLLRDVAEGRPPLEFFGKDLRQRAQRAIDKGLQVILECQVEVDGKLTAWCAQHDHVDLQPRRARSYELASLSGSESVGVVNYLMEIENPSPEVRRAIHAAVDWFEQVKIEGIRVQRIPDESAPKGFDRVVVPDASAPPLWARFYEIGTNRPLFVGRDGIPHEDLADIEVERRTGYSWLGEYASRLLNREYPAWQEKWDRE